MPLVLVGGAEAAAPEHLRRVDGSKLAAALAAGRPVILSGVEVTGALRLPRSVEAPLILRESRLLGRLDGAHRSFSHVLDLSHTEFRGRVDLSGARFGAPVTFERAHFAAAEFALAVFGEAAHFDNAEFKRAAGFSSAEFHGSGSFSGAHFYERADFAGAEFGSFADFSTTALDGTAVFSGARFAKHADFAGTRFLGPDAGGSADFARATFEDGATFFAARVTGGAVFSRATSSGDLSFQDLKVFAEGAGSSPALAFKTVRFLGTTSFTDAEIHGAVTFDQGAVSALDLAGATIDGRLKLPLGRRSGGHIGELRLDLEQSELVDGPGPDDGIAQQAALQLVEESARAADDLATANDARVRRLTIARHRKGPLAESADWTFNYGIWGYGVQPFHQLTVIGGVALLAAGVRWVVRRPGRQTRVKRLRGVVQDLGDSLGALLRLRPPEGAWSVVEYLAFKLLIVVFVLNAANVWPVSRELIEGIF